MCTGTVSPHHILKAFQKGADGVIVAGCHIGDCHYLKGNYVTIKRVAILKELLKFTGFQAERLYLDWISAAEGVRFAELVRAFTQKIKALGPSHLKTSY
jgi:F420-non-reducing hydrogenase iron-sulfur subunit